MPCLAIRRRARTKQKRTEQRVVKLSQTLADLHRAVSCADDVVPMMIGRGRSHRRRLYDLTASSNLCDDLQKRSDEVQTCRVLC